jgi:dUTP pyrophosphatase
MAAVDNIKEKDYKIEYGQRLFQIVAMDGSPLSFQLVDKLSKTDRGTGGFGSTGS